MITYKDGDLLDAFSTGEVYYIGHVVNCQGKMGAGLAKQIKARYPIAFNEYEFECKTWSPINLLGVAQCVPITGADIDKEIYNLFAQEYYGTNKRQLHYGHLANSLFEMARQIKETEGTWNGHKAKVGFPYSLGCGLAGGDWSVVVELIEVASKDMDVIIYKL